LARLDLPADEPRRLSLTIAALGVVFGDIGTSPLYALRACFSDVAGVQLAPHEILGVLSLLFWSLALVISLKYVAIIMRADNHGEGGVLALTTLVLSEHPRRAAGAIAAVGLLGCSFFYGDGVITPAVTVLGAIEGLSVMTPAFEQVVLPLSILALFALFKLQRRGTGAIGALFGPVMVIWFVTIAILGLRLILAAPIVLQAINPLLAISFFTDHVGIAFAVSGAVFLAVTGGEALYADLGHFGRAPIARGWFALVWPCLLLNYFGQAALLIKDPHAISNPFYLLAPPWLLGPLVVLATAASIIASQAVISGVFTVTQQCQQLGYLPRLRILYSSEESVGQVYVPSINWILCAATIGLALGFGSSARLAGAYGVAVANIMLINTVLMMLLLGARRDRLSRFMLGVLCGLVVVDLAFVISNLGKIAEGGWFPILSGLLVFAIMRTWQRGREVVNDRIRREERSVEKFLDRLAREPPIRVSGVAVFPTANSGGIPRTLIRNLKINQVMHEQTIICSVSIERIPRVSGSRRIQVETLGEGLHRVQIRIGFMEHVNVPKALRDAERHGLGFRTDDAIYILGRDDLVLGSPRGMARWRKRLFLLLARNAQYAAASFGIPRARIMEVGGQVEI